MTRPRLRQRLSRVSEVVARPAEAPVPVARDEAEEVGADAGAAFCRMAELYRDQFHLPPDEARARALDGPADEVERARNLPADRVTWLDPDVLGRHDPDAAQRCWDAVKEAARREVRSGHRAARALEGAETSCWSRARFLAVRAELTDAWQPRNPAEQHLVDLMAQHQTLLWHWQDVLGAYASQAELSRRRPDPADRHLEPPRLSAADALDRAVRLVERFQRLYLRALLALQGLRRRPPLVVRRAGQVNIGHQQVNYSG
jgi:hypothetical protein